MTLQQSKKVLPGVPCDSTEKKKIHQAAYIGKVIVIIIFFDECEIIY